MRKFIGAIVLVFAISVGDFAFSQRDTILDVDALLEENAELTRDDFRTIIAYKLAECLIENGIFPSVPGIEKRVFSYVVQRKVSDPATTFVIDRYGALLSEYYSLSPYEAYNFAERFCDEFHIYSQWRSPAFWHQ
ncbi:MAG: hypothetical protein OXI46_11425 [Gemmatimonadota bacterium]|nr:hypothetical protein [Gemmatimonadota bacterium]